MIEAAVSALRGAHNQYAPLPGVPVLRDAVLEHQRSYYGLEPEDLLITFGATEAIAASLLGLCDPGDEVVVLEPYYDSYAACISFAGRRAPSGDACSARLRVARGGAARRGRPAGARAAAQLAAQPDGTGAVAAELELIAGVASSTT